MVVKKLLPGFGAREGKKLYPESLSVRKELASFIGCLGRYELSIPNRLGS